MVSIRSPHKLPGENGMHSRDGSLTKRKKEQWERERVENEQTGGWFAKFGQKHTPGRRRAWATPKDASENEQRPGENYSEKSDGRAANSSHYHQMQLNNEQTNIHIQPMGVEPPPPIDQHPPSPFIHPPPSIPPAMLYGTPSAFPLQAPSAPLHFFTTPSPAAVQPILFGEYQAQCQRQFIAGAMPMFPQFAPPPQAIDTAAFILAAHQQQKFPMGMAHHHPLMPTPPVSCPSSVEEAGGNNSPAEQTQQLHQQNVCHVDIVEQHQQHNANGADSALMCSQSPPGKNNRNKMASPNANFGVRSARRSLSMDASGTWEEELARQVAERKMSAEREAQRALEEERMREREERERVAREEAEREAEERRRMDRIEARDQTERSTLACLQRAQREAELLRRAKLFRHILLDGDGQADMKTAREVLKCEPEEEAVLNDVIRQLREFDRQKRLANESCGSLSPSTGKATPKSTKEAKKMAGGKATSPAGFSRASSWNVKHSRTMPTDFSPPFVAQQSKMPSPGAVILSSTENHQQKNVALPSKRTPKTADKERQSAIVTAATASVSSPQYHQNNYGNATIISPNIASSAGGAPYGSSGSEKSTPDKKSFRQKVQNAVRNGAAAMLRRRESMGKTPTTPPNGGATPKVLRTVGLFEQVTLRHRTSSTSSNKQKQSDQQQHNQRLNNNSGTPHNPSSPHSPTTAPTDSAKTNGTAPVPFPYPPLRSQPHARVGTSPLYSAQTFEFLLPPPPPVRRRHQIETMTQKAKAELEEEEKQKTKQEQQRQFEGEEEEENCEENGSEENGGPKETTAKCHQQNGRRENGTGKAMSQHSPPGSSANSSSSSASLLRFRAALDSPFGSREDLSNNLTTVSNGYAAFPPAPPRFLGGPLRHANGGASVAHPQHFLAPPSPFRRAAPCPGDSSEPLLRRSLRSPTMRRLQESLQSLAEDVPVSPATLVSARGDAGRTETPKPFNCRTSQYRSLNLKRDTERQKQILGHLAQVRAQLKNSQVQIERTISEKQQQNLA
ncbi:hypothetical protein niasHT_037943 [Heterodera trifolii]|uniref:Uncharacterized protein n=1 Tax=Heterodera trifolii TaxID=157864 RepID=A0ABD2I4A4_9BILA